MFRRTMARALRAVAFAPVTAKGAHWAKGSLLTLRDLRRGPRDEVIAMVRGFAGGSYLGGTTAACRVLGRYKMLVDTEDMGVGIHLLVDGLWEMWLTEVMLDLVKPGMCAVDVGANLGYFSLLMSDLVGDAGTLHAFEPNPPIAARLRQSLRINGYDGRATVHAIALDEQAGESLLAVPADGPGGAHVIVPQQGRTGTAIRTERFDAIPALHDADFVKIDVEGAEDRVWRGMAGVFARGRPMTIVVEFTAARYPDPAGFVAAIVRDGFSIAVIDHLRGVIPTDAAALLAGPAAEERLILLRR